MAREQINRVRLLVDELTLLIKQLPELESRSDLRHVAGEVEKRIEDLRQQIKDLEQNM